MKVIPSQISTVLWTTCQSHQEEETCTRPLTFSKIKFSFPLLEIVQMPPISAYSSLLEAWATRQGGSSVTLAIASLSYVRELLEIWIGSETECVQRQTILLVCNLLSIYEPSNPNYSITISNYWSS